MLEIKMAKQALKTYVNQYDPSNDRIRVKIGHIERVATNAKQIAKGIELPEEDISLAELIGLLHDIGRFEQVKKYNTFHDQKSINHGELGVQILFEEGKIREFTKDQQYDKIIKTAILNHNRNKEDMEITNEKELLHSKIIRDADKIDILYMLTFENKETAWGSSSIEEEKISNEIYQGFMEKGEIDYQKRKTAADTLVGHFAYAFDLNYNQSLQIIKEKEYFKKIYQRFQFEDQQTQEKLNKIYKKVEQYLNEK